MGMGFGIFFGYTQIKLIGHQHKPFFWNFKLGDGIVFFGIEFFVYLQSQMLSQVHIVAIAAQTIAVVGFNLDGAVFHLIEDALIR